MQSYLPFLSWAKGYNKSLFLGDLFAGLTVGVMLIPQGMAYAMLAGLPPIYGLYAATIPLLIYALLGTSRQLSVGPTAMSSLLIFAGVSALAPSGVDEFVTYAILLAFMVGGIQLLFGILRLGFVVNFLSYPVMKGYTTAAALIISINQFKHLLGVNIGGGKFYEVVYNIYNEISNAHLLTLLIGGAGIALLLLIKRLYPKLPNQLLVVVLGIVVVQLFSLDISGVKIIGTIPEGLPSFQLPLINMEAISSLLPAAFTIALVGFMESYSVAKTLQQKHKDYDIKTNQELVALGAANILGSLFSSFPVTGGFSRSAVNDEAGAKTGVAGIISAALVILTLLFLTPYFYYLPTTILAAMIVVAVSKLIEVKTAIFLWHHNKIDFLMFIITAAVTLFVGIVPGIGAGVLMALGYMVYNVSYPHLAVLGKVKGRNVYRNVDRYDDLEERSDVLIFRPDARLFYANIAYVLDELELAIKGKPMLTHLIVDARAIASIDSSALMRLEDFIESYKGKGIKVLFSSVNGPVRDYLQKMHLTEQIGEKNFFLNISDAMDCIEGDCPHENTRIALQYNQA